MPPHLLKRGAQQDIARCPFQLQNRRVGNELVAVGPLNKSEQFDNSPVLIATKTTKRLRRLNPHVRIMSGKWQPGDAFYLATDALAQWLLARHEAQRPAWALLRAVGDYTFPRLVDQLRTDKVLHNDDTTLLRVEVA